MGIRVEDAEDEENSLTSNGRGVVASKAPLPRESPHSDFTTSPTQRTPACCLQTRRVERKLKKIFVER